MAGEPEEITMLPYQIYKALTDERTRAVVAAAERHRLLAAGRYSSTDTNESSSRFKDVTARTVALLQVRRGAGVRSTVTSVSGAGPMGCSA